MHSHCCKDSQPTNLLLSIVIIFSTLFIQTQCCSSGYKFTLIPPINIICNPFFAGGYMDVLCEITVTPNKPMVSIDWYFQSSMEGSLPIRLVNGIHHKHSINNVQSSDHYYKILTSTLRLYNVSNKTDTGQYSCQGSVGSNQKLLPKPSLTIAPLTWEPVSFSCKSLQLREQNERCADVIYVPESISSNAVLTSSHSNAPLSSYASALTTTVPSSYSSDLQYDASTMNNVPHSFIFTPSSSVIPTSDLHILNTINSVTSSFPAITPSSTVSSSINSISNQKPSVISSDNKVTKSTNNLLTVITATSVGLESMEPPVTATSDSAVDSQGFALHWLYIIATLLTLSLFILVLIFLLFTAFFYCHRSSPSLSAIEDVVLRQRPRRPSDPLPPIRDSMILMSNISETTTKSSNISGALGPNTIIHCSPLQNQLISNRLSLQDMSFSLQCGGGNGAASSFTVYAEVEDINETITTAPPLRAANSTYSSHCYTLPPNDPTAYDTNTGGESLTGQWSPILIYQRGQKREENEECDRLSLLSKSDVTLSDIDDTFSHSYHHGNPFIVHQQQQLPNQLNSLREQSFSFHHVPINSHMKTHSSSNSSSNSSNTSSIDSNHNQITSLQLLFNDNHTPEDSVIEIRSSSCSSSGCTDLSKYSGDYERDPNYMKALGLSSQTTIHHSCGVHNIPSHGHTREELYDNTQQQQQQEEDILNERELDSGMDGMYCCPTVDYDTRSQNGARGLCHCDDYKSLESLTRNPSPIYMKPVWKQKKHNDSVFTTIAV